MRARTSLLVVLSVTCAALSGCGQTGALYLPTNDSEVVSKGPEAGTAPAASPAASSPTAATADTAADSAAADAEAARKREPAAPTTAPK